MKKRLRVLAFSAALVMLATSLSGCGGGGASSKENTDSTGTSAPASSGTAAAAEGAAKEGNLYLTGLPLVEEQETFKIAWPRGSYSTIGAGEKDALSEAEKATNVKIDWMEIEGTAWNEKVNIILASQDLPDAFLGGMSSMIPANLEAFVDMNDYIDKYAPSLAQAIAKHPSVKTQLTEADGSIRSLATGNMLKADETTSTIYWINSDWLKAVNKEIPETVDEFYDVLQAFRDGDPNGNGQKDEIPFSFCNANWAGKLSSMFGLFGVLNPDNKVLVENGKVVFQPTQEGFKEALQFFNKLYTEGLLDSEGFSETADQHDAKINQNILGIMPIYDPSNKIGPDHPYVPLPPILSKDGSLLYEGSMEPKVPKGLAVTIACETPATLVRYYDYVNSSMENKLTWGYGKKDYLWTLNEDGSWNQLDENLKEGEVWDRMRYVNGFGPDCFAFYTPEEGALIPDRFVQGRLDAVKLLEPYYPKESYHAVADEADVISEKNLLKTEIDAYITTFVADSVMKGLDDAGWQKHLETCKTLNVDRYVELMQIPYDKFNEMS